MKKRLCRFILVFGVALLLSGCGDSIVSENQMKDDIENYGEANVVYIDYGSSSDSYYLDVTDLEVNKRQTNEKDDTVYCTVMMEDENYRYTADYTLYYNYYDEGGWILDDYSSENSVLTPLVGVPVENSDSEMSQYYFDDYEFVDSYLDEESYENQLEYHVSYQGDYVSCDGNVQLTYWWYNEGNYGCWTPELIYNDYGIFDWDVAGEWGYNYFDYQVLEINIDSIDLINEIAMVEAVVHLYNSNGSDQGASTDGMINSYCWMGIGEDGEPKLYIDISMTEMLGEDDVEIGDKQLEISLYGRTYESEYGSEYYEARWRDYDLIDDPDCFNLLTKNG